MSGAGLYERIYATVRRVPPGRVATYGQIAKLTGGCGARQVGYALAALPEKSTVPWQRIINSQGRVSLRSGGGHDDLQRQLLEEEGIEFSLDGRIDLRRFSWQHASGAGDLFDPPD
jgi:methylated-DNA-protein-cysteine methyltransferase-like protein